ncbi:unnamed protein product [Amaranthus hypochondriacus]
MPTCIKRLKNGAQLVDYWVTIYIHPFKRESMKQRAKRGTTINPYVIDLFCHILPISKLKLQAHVINETENQPYLKQFIKQLVGKAQNLQNVIKESLSKF